MVDSKYLLNRDAKESARLIAQHDWLKALVGCNLHPAIPTQGNLRIADVATGTAIWLLDMASSLPAETQFVGFDISTAQFPPEEGRPSNVTLHEHNVTEPFADEFLGSFDIVAVRLITAGLRGDDWDAAVKNVNSLLKPGGYLQWIEPVHSSMQVFQSQVGAPNAATRKTVEYFLDAYKATLYPGPLQLTGLCAKHGLEELAIEVFPSDHFPDKNKVRDQGKLFLAGACTALMSVILKNELGLTEETLKETVDKAMKELDGGLYLRSEMQFTVHRKPA